MLSLCRVVSSLSSSSSSVSSARLSAYVFRVAQSFHNPWNHQLALFSSDSHPDFASTRHEAPRGTDTSAVDAQIKNDVDSHKVFVFMKVCRILDLEGAEYGSRDVLLDQDIREGVKKFSDWPTIPQVYVNGEFVGGADIMYNMHKEGDLKPLLEEAGVELHPPPPSSSSHAPEDSTNVEK